MDLKDIRVGDVVRVRAWDDMASEFGLCSYGNISCPVYEFVKNMRGMCGKEFTVEGFSDKNTLLGHGTGWEITPSMVEPAIEINFGSDFDLIDYLREWMGDSSMIDKKELVERVASLASVSKTEAGEVIDGFVKVIMESVANGDSVRIKEFGIFERRSRKATQSILAGEVYDVKEHYVVGFKPSKVFKRKVKGDD